MGRAIRHIIYDNNGKILRTGICSESIYSLQAKAGEDIMEGSASDIDHKIVDGKIVPKSIGDLGDGRTQ